MKAAVSLGFSLLAWALACTQRTPSSGGSSTSSSSPLAPNGEPAAACEPTTYGPEPDPPLAPGEICPAGMILVPGGTLAVPAQPSPSAGLATPARTLKTSAFCIDPQVVTIGSFNTCGPCVASRGVSPGPSERPMTHALPDEMAAYCRASRRRLPSEIELEMAARASVIFAPGASEVTSTEICACDPASRACERGWVVKTGADPNTPMARTLYPASSKSSPGPIGFRCAATPTM